MQAFKNKIWGSLGLDDGEPSVRDVQARIEDVLNQAEALEKLAKSEGRKMTTLERAEHDRLLNKKNGKVTQLQGAMAHAAANERIQESKVFAAHARKQLYAKKPFGDIPMIEGNGNTPMHAIPKATSKLQAFTGPNAEQEAFDCGQWLAAQFARAHGGRNEAAELHLENYGHRFMATAIEANPTAGGYLVPTPLSNAIIEFREKDGISRQLSSVQPMGADTLSVPKQTAGQTVYYVSEATEITDSDQTWGSVNLNCAKRGIMTKISNELLRDNVVGLADQTASRIGHEFAKQEDSEWINGDATSTYGGVTGLLSAIGSAGIATADTGEDTWGELDLEDHTDTMGLVPAEHSDGAVWVCSSQYYYSVMFRILAEAGGNTVAQLEQGNAMRPTFLGRPVYFSSQMPTATAASTVHALYGNFKNACLIGSRVEVEIGVSPDRYFELDVTAIRGITRYDINIHEAGDSSTVGAYAALKTAA